jgi:hypothetical protein
MDRERITLESVYSLLCREGKDESGAYEDLNLQSQVHSPSCRRTPLTSGTTSAPCINLRQSNTLYQPVIRSLSLHWSISRNVGSRCSSPFWNACRSRYSYILPFGSCSRWDVLKSLSCASTTRQSPHESKRVEATHIVFFPDVNLLPILGHVQFILFRNLQPTDLPSGSRH